MAGAPIGNKNASKNRLWSDAIKRALSKRSRVDQIDALEKLAEVLIDKCLEGDLQALKEMGDRIEGKAHQTATVESFVTSVRQVTDDELAAIATGSGEGASQPESGEGQPQSLH